jgi:hypothetical protein
MTTPKKRRLAESADMAVVATNPNSGEVLEAWDPRPRPRWRHHNPAVFDRALTCIGVVSVLFLTGAALLML